MIIQSGPFSISEPSSCALQSYRLKSKEWDWHHHHTSGFVTLHVSQETQGHSKPCNITDSYHITHRGILASCISFSGLAHDTCTHTHLLVLTLGSEQVREVEEARRRGGGGVRNFQVLSFLFLLNYLPSVYLDLVPGVVESGPKSTFQCLVSLETNKQNNTLPTHHPAQRAVLQDHHNKGFITETLFSSFSSLYSIATTTAFLELEDVF